MFLSKLVCFFVFSVAVFSIPSELDVPKWVVKSGCPGCTYCLLLNGTVTPFWCLESLEDLPAHVKCSFPSLSTPSPSNLDILSVSENGGITVSTYILGQVMFVFMFFW